MKLQCKQCGASLAVTSPDAYITCPYCGAKAVINGFSGTSFYHRVVISEKDVLKLFNAEAIASTSLYWFPYKQYLFERAFTQPYTELENYSPPSADKRVWDEKEVSGNIIPVDPKLLDDSGIIYHPIWVAINSSTSQGIMVDAVSGRKLVQPLDDHSSISFDPLGIAKRSFFISIIPTIFVFLVFRMFSLFWALILAMGVAIYSPIVWKRLVEKNKNE